jgi:PAS domain S-box-containing protein
MANKVIKPFLSKEEGTINPTKGSPGDETREREEHYRLLFDNSFDAILLTLPDGSVLDANSASCKIFGQSLKDIRQARLNDLVYTNDTDGVATLEELLRTGKYSGELKMVRKDGTIFDGQISSGNFKDSRGISVTSTIIRDISERRKTEHELQKSEAFLYNIFEQSPYPKWLSDKAGTLLEVNKACLDMLNLSKEDLIGKYNILQDNIIVGQGYMPLVKNVYEKGEVAKFVLHYDSSNLTQLKLRTFTNIIIYVTIFPIKDDSGKAKNAIIHMMDISERRHAEEALLESEKRYRQLVELSPNGIAIYQEQKLVYVNPAGMAMLGAKDPKELLGKDVLSLIHPESKAKVIKRMGLVAKGLSVQSVEERLVRLDGSSFLSEVVALSTTYHDKLAGQVIVRDITKSKQAEEALKESEARLRELNATKDKFFSIIAHDLKSPFNSILGFSDLLSKNIRHYDLEKTEKFVRQINLTAKHTLVLLENLLTWAKTQTRQLCFAPENFNLLPILEEITEELSSSAKIKNISLNNLQTNDTIIYADPNMLQTILRNLISNAIKFTNSGGTVDILVLPKPDHTEISISDNGIGMDLKTQKELFKMDTHIIKAGTANEKGSGIGLVLCKEFAEKHGGKLWVTSEPGKGSKFCFSLPQKTNDLFDLSY